MQTFFRLLMTLILFFPLFTCEKVPPLEKIEVDQDQAVIAFLEGDVNTMTGTGWKEAAVNDILTKGDVLKTGEKGFCELQCTNSALIMLQDNTMLEIEHLFLRDDSYGIDMGLSLGTILCKVDRLTIDDGFTVSTEAAVCAVRGTVFGIQVRPEEKTSIFVKNGSVSIVPGALHVRKLKEKLKHSPVLMEEVIAEIEKQVVMVEALQEVVIDRETMEETKALLFDINAAIEEVSQKEKVEDEEKQELVEQVRKKTLKARSYIPPPVTVSGEHKRLLEKAEQQQKKKLIIIKVYEEESEKDESHGKENTIDMKAEEAGEDTIIDKEEIALLEEETTDDRKQSIYITTLPEKAKVIVDDSFHGISPFTLTDIPPGEHTLRFEKEGYRVHEKVVIVEEGQDISFEVVLKEAIPDMINIVIESDPPGAGIHLDGEYMGRSPRTIPDVEFGQHTVMIEMEGFSTINDVISVNDTGNKYLYPLIPVEIEE